MYSNLKVYNSAPSVMSGGMLVPPEPLQSLVEENKYLQSDPRLWGPHLWAYMHYSAAHYPDNPTLDEINFMKQWLCSLPVTIPCNTCKQHYNSYINQNRSNMDNICSNRNNLFKFLVNIHNEVNKRNGKETMSIEQAKRLYKY
jgi:hypothetical protein